MSINVTKLTSTKPGDIPQEIRQMAKVFKLTFQAMLEEGFTEDQALKAISFMMVAGGAVAEEGPKR